MKIIPIMKNAIVSTDNAELDKIKKLPNSRNSLPKNRCISYFEIKSNNIPKLKERNAKAIR